MKILYSKFIELPVYTETDTYLGKVSDLEFDLDNYGILKIYLKSKNPLRGLFEDTLIINISQIIKITNEKIVVDNNVKVRKAKKEIKLKLPSKKTQMATVSVQEK
jgi:sporulation protein YlmC with PRC-barrel domain